MISRDKPATRGNRLIQAILVIAVFLFLTIIPDAAVHWLGLAKTVGHLAQAKFISQLLFAGLYVTQQLVTLCLCVMFIMLLFRKALLQALRELGLGNNFKTGWLLGLAATLPMPVIFSIVGHASFNAEIALQVIVFGLFTGFAEETLFRGFAFGLLYRKVHLGFWLSIILPTVFFAAGHLYQVHGILDSLGILAVTGLGSLWFAWLYVRWEYNLWVPIAMHGLMDSWWTVFSASGTALGNTEANLARLLTILLSIVLTLWHCHWDWRKAFIHIRPSQPFSVSEATGAQVRD
ncbi:MAG: CPBP family intramembrane glutamic endopeptidase [Gammaproteobacteria bacterium]